MVHFILGTHIVYSLSRRRLELKDCVSLLLDLMHDETINIKKAHDNLSCAFFRYIRTGQ